MNLSMRVLQLVDSLDYVKQNCFQHQLYVALKGQHDVTTVELAEMSRANSRVQVSSYDVVLSTLKQRTLMREAERVAKFIGQRPVVVYDQDPWHSVEDGCPYKGAYDVISKHLNVKTFAVTSKWWSDFMISRGFPSTFVRMWVLPEYCDVGQRFENRKVPVGFIGGLHPRRARLVESIRSAGIKVETAGSTLGYVPFLQAMNGIGIFVHSEDHPIIVDGVTHNMGTGMWVKDVEAAARGCFSIRNAADTSDTYVDGLDTVKLYRSLDEVPRIIDEILTLDSEHRWQMMNDAVTKIRATNAWKETVERLITQ